MKRCSKCLQKRSLHEFYRLAKSKDGRRPDCKKCKGKPPLIITTEERFWAKVERTLFCWEWQGSTNTNNGYGRFWLDKKQQHIVAHRYMWLVAYGAIPGSLEVCHTCDNPKCVRPSHLFLGTHFQNMQQAAAKGAFGTLIPDDVQAIRQLLSGGDLTQEEIGLFFNVSRGAIGHIKAGSTWAWLK